jgi:hypothetical protein
MTSQSQEGFHGEARIIAWASISSIPAKHHNSQPNIFTVTVGNYGECGHDTAAEHAAPT